jgi:hypothetical protein
MTHYTTIEAFRSKFSGIPGVYLLKVTNSPSEKPYLGSSYDIGSRVRNRRYNYAALFAQCKDAKEAATLEGKELVANRDLYSNKTIPSEPPKLTAYIRRVLSKNNLEPLGETGCLTIPGKKPYRDGYLYISGKLAHRVSYFLHTEEWPLGLVIRHRCNNKTCVNPEHLLVGSTKDNMEDWKKSEGYKKAMKKREGVANNRKSQLEPYLEDILEMRRKGMKYREIAPLYGVKDSSVYNFLKKKGLSTKYGRQKIFLEFDGERKTLKEWARDPRCKVCDTTLKKRKELGMNDAECILTPPTSNNNKKKRIDSPKKLAEGISPSIYVSRINNGWTEEDAAEVPHGYTRKSWKRKKELDKMFPNGIPLE